MIKFTDEALEGGGKLAAAVAVCVTVYVLVRVFITLL